MLRQALRGKPGGIALLAVLAAAWGLVPSAVAEMDYPGFVERIRESGVTDPGDALALLPDEMRLSYTMVYASRSLQHASLEHPRVLLFGTDARFIVTFNGHPDQYGYEQLEVLHFDEASERFELRSIGFGEEVRFSEANPDTCTNCHRPSPQPIWKDYGSANVSDGHGQWVGTYGSNHDLVPDAVRPALLQFWDLAPRHTRYRHLLRDERSDLFPYQPTDATFRWQHRFRPNNRLSRLLARLNARRIARLLSESDAFPAYRNLLLSWFLECDAWQSDPAFAGEIRRLFAERFPEAEHAALYADLATVTQVDRFVIPFMLEKLFTGLDVYQWSMGLATPTGQRYHEGLQTIDQLIAGRLLQRVAAEDERLAPFYREVSFAEAYGAPLYTRIQPGEPLWKGEIGGLYDSSGRYHDLELAKGACELVVPAARRELETRAQEGDRLAVW